MKYLKLVLIVFFFVDTLSAQEYTKFKKYNWLPKKMVQSISPEQEKEDAIILKNFVVYEYALEDHFVRKMMMLYHTTHKVIHINSDLAIEKYNRVYIPMSGVEELMDLKVRTISPRGEIRILDKTNIKEMENVEGHGSYKIFAVEGVEIGCEIEYIIKLRKTPSSVVREVMQSENISENSELMIVTPSYLTLKSKSYNGFPELKKGKSKARDEWRSGKVNMPRMVNEKLSNYRNGLMRVEFSIGNASGPSANAVGWENIGKTVYESVYEEYPNAVAIELAKLKIEKLTTDEKIKEIEKYIKSNYAIKNLNAKDGERLNLIIKNKYANERGMIKLFMAFLEAASIEYKLVFTSDRTSIKLDPLFPSWTYIENVFLYFQKSDKYLAPTEFDYRYPMIPFNWYDIDGMFVTRKKIVDDMTPAVYKTEKNYIAPSHYMQNTDSMDISVKIDFDLEKATLDIRKSFGGEKAMYYLPYYSKMTEANRLKLIEQVMNFSKESGDLLNYTVENTDNNRCSYEVPLIFKGTLVSTSLIEKAGNKYMVKVGEIIGEQNEMYGDSITRVSPVVGHFACYYYRKIQIEIPEGYNVKNLESLAMDVSFDFEQEKKTCAFISEYKIENNKLIVEVKEYYKRINYPASFYLRYRDVVNAAADFNKIIILFEK